MLEVKHMTLEMQAWLWVMMVDIMLKARIILKNLLINRTGYEGVRNTVQAQGGSVGWANNQAIINGQAYNTDGMINANGTLYADPNFLKGLNNQYQDPYQGKQDKIF